MRTLYAACLARLGLSQPLAAQLHSVSLQTVKNWCADRTEVPDGVWQDLKELEAAIVDQSEAIREHWDAGQREGGEIEDAVRSHSGLMALADFVLTLDEAPPKSWMH